jgi:cytochrome b
MEQTRSRVLVWDLPVRTFHVLFAGGFLVAYGIAALGGEHSPTFHYHPMIGMTLVVLAILRLLWGLIGTKWARLRALDLNPVHLFRYVTSVFSREGMRSVGHNPATSWTMLTMMALAFGLAWTGWLMARGNEGLKEIHEVLAHGFLALAVLHIAGVLLHVAVKRDPIIYAMADGKKAAAPEEGIQSAQPLPAAALLLLTGFFFFSLVARYDLATNSTAWPLTGIRLPLGESEAEEGGGSEGEHSREEGEEREEGEYEEHD